jgi:curli biogenesis system outer membrane secretion channel CsgG
MPAGALHRVRLAALWALCLTALFAMCCPRVAHGQPALPAVVVWDFDNQSPPGLGESAAYLRRSLSENLTVTLLQSGTLQVVERQRLKDLLAEQKLSAAELADEDARVRLGRIVGAGRMVFGGYFLLGDDVQVHVRVVDTATSRVIFSDEAAAPLSQVMRQVEPLNRRLARALGGAAANGGNYAAASWKAYDAALGLADAGRLDEAVQALQALLGRDKSFVPAERQLLALLDKLARR